MDILFRRKYTYAINKSFGDTVDDFSKITTRSWRDFSDNITGKLNEDYSFLFFHKWTLGYINGIFGNKFVYLQGQISAQREKTIITIQLNPNLGLVFLHHLLAILFIIELFSIKTTINTQSELFLLISYPIFGPIILGTIILMTNGLKKNFEKILDIRPEQS
ncbi:hypothetical protein ACO2Q8_19430 [Larkinella sp. VNQ87]|uniref:hypothetical protein n=1 Tax=Larkinella sp. VNQ87 TaxID=3400921 RepID=UPI003C0E098C